MKQLHLTIHGKVQGVFFRETAKEKAEELGLVGYVKNMPDRSVEVVAQGNEDALKKMLEWCRIGTQWAKVEQVDEVWMDVGSAEFGEFKIVW
ncbi:MAG: acylphosphatase [Candidatus Magasanikbacteria bacterium]